MTNDQLSEWTGEFGDDYTDRNIPDDVNIANRVMYWTGVFSNLTTVPMSMLEVGANVGANLVAIDTIYSTIGKPVTLYYNEPNNKALKIIKEQTIRDIRKVDGTAQGLNVSDGAVDLSFTCGVLIHIHPNDLSKAMEEIYRASKKYIVCSEYFSPDLREIQYRGKSGMLWTRDFGSEWLDKFKLRCINYNFAWKRLTGMDNLTTWVFEKVN